MSHPLLAALTFVSQGLLAAVAGFGPFELADGITPTWWAIRLAVGPLPPVLAGLFLTAFLDIAVIAAEEPLSEDVTAPMCAGNRTGDPNV